MDSPASRSPSSHAKMSKRERKDEKKEKKRRKSEKKEQQDGDSATIDTASSSAAAAAASPTAASSSPATPSSSSSTSSIRLFSSTSPRADSMILHYISSFADAQQAVAVLKEEHTLGVDCEGVNLSRTGELCLIQVSTGLHRDATTAASSSSASSSSSSAAAPVTSGTYHVYLFDICALGRGAFTCGLGDLLTQSTPTKLFYDVRRDSEALFHQYGILLRGVCDIQLLEIARRRLRNESLNYLPGLARLLSDRFSDLDASLQTIKDGMSGKYAETPDLWRRRPLTRDQTVYAAIDVVLLHVLLEEITSPTPVVRSNKSGKSKKSTGKNADGEETKEDKDESDGEDKKTKEEKREDEDTTSSSKMDTTTDESATSSSAADPSSSSLPSYTRRGYVPKKAIYVNQQTRAIIQQYSDLVWAASIRDTAVEPDMWSRRHVPLVFHHATFPLSLQQECQTLLTQRESEERRLKEEASGNKKGKKRKDVPVSAPITVPASFSVLAASSADATDDSSSSSASKKSSSRFVTRTTNPIARNNYSGLANTLKHLRAKNEKEKSGTTTEGRQLSSASSPSSTPSSSTRSSTSLNSSTPAATSATPFHPNLTSDLIAQQKKQQARAKQTTPAKRQKLETF